MRPFQLWMFLASAAFLSSCCPPLQQNHVDLSYTSEMSELDCLFPCKETTVYVNSFKDERENAETVVELKGRRGNTHSCMKTKSNVSKWVTTALKEDLRGAGYRIVNDESDANLVIEGRISNLGCDALASCKAGVSLEVSVTRGDEVILDETYEGSFQQRNLISHHTEFADALERSLQDAIRKIVTDIHSRI